MAWLPRAYPHPYRPGPSCNSIHVRYWQRPFPVVIGTFDVPKAISCSSAARDSSGSQPCCWDVVHHRPARLPSWECAWTSGCARSFQQWSDRPCPRRPASPNSVRTVGVMSSSWLRGSVWSCSMPGPLHHEDAVVAVFGRRSCGFSWDAVGTQVVGVKSMVGNHDHCGIVAGQLQQSCPASCRDTHNRLKPRFCTAGNPVR